MQYFVVWPDGQKFGPASLDTLNQWAGEGRINADTLLESVTDGSQIKAGAVPGLTFVSAAPAPHERPAEAEQGFAPAQVYFVVMPDGAKYGPADVATLNQWAMEGRINAQTSLVEESTGRTVPLSSVPGISVGLSSPQSPIEQPSYQAPSVPYPRQDPMMYGDEGKGDFNKSIIFSVIGFICCPPLFGGLGIYFGNKAKNAGHPNGQTAVILGVVSIVVGIALGIAVNLGALSRVLPTR